MLERVPRVLFLFRSDEASGSGVTVVGKTVCSSEFPREGTTRAGQVMQGGGNVCLNPSFL